MGIDIYAHWRGQTDATKAEQSAAWLSTGAGGAGYLREAYHGEPYATKFLFAEAFETGEARISAALLRERLPRALALVEEREQNIYQATDEQIEDAKQSFREFVALCEEKEKETGEPVLVIASY
jgi:hypothetical protein